MIAKIIKKLINSDLVIQKDGHSYMRMTASFEAAQHPALVVPFFGQDQVIIARKLTGAQRQSCGDFSLIETIQDSMRKDGRKPVVSDMVAYAEMQHRIIKKSLISPTYDEIMALNEYDALRIEGEKELKELEIIINDMKPGTKKNELLNSYNAIKMNTQFLLPYDFISFIMSFALDIDGSDIKDVTADMLYDAAILAIKGNNDPHDHMPGNFVEHHLPDIDRRAWIEYQRRTEDKRKS